MKKPRFLVIQLRQIGDVLVSTTLCETLKKSFPHSQVDYCVYPYAAPVAQHNPFIDNLLIIPNGAKNNALWKLLKNILFMRKQKYDYVIEVLNTPKSINLARLSGGKIIIGRASGKNRTRHYDIAVTYTPDFLADVAASDSVKNRLALLAPINLKSKNKLEYVTNYKMYLTSQELEHVKERLVAAGIDFNKPLFYFSLSSRSPQQKQWSLPYFIETIQTCINRYGAQIVTVPVKSSVADDEYVKTQLTTPTNFFILSDLTLREVAAVIAQCNLFVGNDSGPRHIAIGVDTPSVAIFSPQINHFNWDLPNHPKHRSVTLNTSLKLDKAAYLKLQDTISLKELPKFYEKITPDLVLAEIEKLISRSAYSQQADTFDKH